MTSLEKHILSLLNGSSQRAQLVARYVGAQGLPGRKPNEISQLTFLGHGMPRLREMAEKGALSETKYNLKDWVQVFQDSKYFEVKSVALYWISHKKYRNTRLSEIKSKELLDLVDHVDNWAISDSLSDLFAFLLEQNPKLFPIYQSWNSSKNPWIRRQSIVGIYCYARFRKKPISPKKVLPLVKTLLKDPHVYVQKGVGWTLREIYNLDPKLQIEFVRKNLGDISGVAWFATSEFYPLKLKKELVEKRRLLRKQKNK